MDKKTQLIANKHLRRLVESALMIAMAAVLSLIRLLDLPYGGSITACSGLPIVITAYRYGTPWGLLTGLAYGLVQFFIGAGVLSYCPTALSAAAVILLDYLLAFAALGLGGLFRGRMPQGKALVLGTLLAGAARYGCHVLSGCTVWAGLSIPDEQALLYSLGYNATYMIPEILVTALGGWYLSRTVDLRGDLPRRAAESGTAPHLLPAVCGLVSVAAGITDILLIASRLQDPQTGGFAPDGLTQVPWIAVAAVTAVGAAAGITGYIISRRRKK